MRGSVRLVAGGVTGVLAAGLLAGAASPAGAGARTSAPLAPAVQPAASTDAAEARRVDAVPTPALDWYDCYDFAQCATVDLPLDYDEPAGETVEIGVLRVPARDPQRRIGSLFVNPGGPGVPAIDMALSGPFYLGQEIVDRFDIVGFDPRGVLSSDQVHCFDSVEAQQRAAGPLLNDSFPYGQEAEQRVIAAAKALGRACSDSGGPVAGAMSTAEVARDMDVLRRALGDEKLTYLGFSYGSALGQYYANMFPDRFRAIVVDGVINPVSWVGDESTRNITLDDRLRSADGAYRALREVFARCDAAGPEACDAAGDLEANLELATQRLKEEPLVLDGGPQTITYSDFVEIMLSDLYAVEGPQYIVDDIALLLTLTDPGTATDQRQVAGRAFTERLNQLSAERDARGRDFPYNNSDEAFSGVTCTDGVHPADAEAWPELTAEADRRAPYFGRAWGWSSVACASDTWTVRDEDAYVGPFNRTTGAPVLVVGNYWDPATNYDDAVGSAELLPNSRLLTSDNWGHTAYGTSDCVTTATDRYLLDGTLPGEGTVCVGDYQPFVAADSEQSRRASAARTQRAPARAEDLAKLPRPAGEPTLLPPVAQRPGLR